MKKIKKLWLATIAVLWCSITMSAYDIEEGGIAYNITSSANKTVELTRCYGITNVRDIVIPSTVTYNNVTYSVTSIGKYAFNAADMVTLVIPNSVKSIGDGAFDKCFNLSSITIPSSVTSIGSYAFSDCFCLTSITIPNSVENIGEGAFEFSALTGITIPNNIKSIEKSTFNGCKSLSSVTIPSSVTSIGSDAFCGCESLSSVTIPNSVKNLGESVFENSALTSVLIPNSVISIGEDAFFSCKKLASVTIGSGVTSIAEGAFYGCSSLQSISIPNNVASIGESAFAGCDNLKKVELHCMSIGTWFSGNRSTVEEIVLGDMVSTINAYAFQKCSNLTKVTIGDNVTSIGEGAFAICSNLQSIVIPNKVTSIGAYAFQACSSLTNVTIGNNVSSIGTMAFWDCPNLKYVTNYSSLTIEAKKTDHGYVAYNASEVINKPGGGSSSGGGSGGGSGGTSGGESGGTSGGESSDGSSSGGTSEGNLVLDGFTFSKVSGVNTLVSYSGNTSTLIFPSFDDMNYVIGEDVFKDHSEITSITFSNSVTGIGMSAFQNCSGLRSITIPSSVTSIGVMAFFGCTNLKSVLNFSNLVFTKGFTDYGWIAYYADEVTNYSSGGGSSGESTTIDGFTFEKINEINTIVSYSGNAAIVTLPANYNGGTYAIGASAFKSHSEIEDIEIPNCVTSIGESAFRGCTGLTSITIPSSVTSIGSLAFLGCSNLERVINYSNLVFTKGSTDYGYIANYADDVTNYSNYLYVNGFTFYKVNGVNTLFSYSGNATILTLPANYNGNSYVIGKLAFESCESLKEVIIPNSVTAIEEAAFYDCTNLVSITIGSSVRRIESSVFEDCYSLESIRFVGTTPPVIEQEFSNSDLGYINLYVPEGSISTYRAADVWGEFESITDGCYTLNYMLDGKVYETVRIAYGTKITPLDAPIKEGYTFSGWKDIPTTMPAKDVTVTGNFTINSYNLTYMVDGKVYKTEQVVYGSTLTPLAEPTQKGFSFSGWSEIPQTMPAKDVTVTGQFVAGVYTLTYMVDGEVYRIDTIAYGNEIIAIEEPTKEGYTFSEWINLPTIMPAYNVTVNAEFIKKQYSVTFVVDGEEVESMSLYHGASIRIPNISVPYGYTLVWDEYPEIMPAKDLTIIGKIIAKVYTLTYKVDNEEYWTDSIAYGNEITTVDEPTKEGHTFSGWENVPSIMPARNVTVYGHFTVNQYRVSFVVDGEEVSSEVLYYYGDEILPPYVDVPYGYSLVWNEYPTTMPAEDIVVNGSIVSMGLVFTLTYMVDGEVYRTDSVVCGREITAIDVPVKEGYTFSGWEDIPTIMPAYDVTVYGHFTVNQYRVTFVVDGEEVSSEVFDYGQTIWTPYVEVPYGYTLVWDEYPEATPAEDITVIGQFIANVYALTYMVDDEVYRTDSVVCGREITAIEDPIKEGYTFSGWEDIPSIMPAYDVTVYGYFTVNQYRVTFVVDGEEVGSEFFDYGQSIWTPYVEVPDGYTLVWDEYPEATPAEDITVTGQFIANVYALTYMVDNGMGYEVYHVDSLACGSIVVPVEEPVMDGYTFSGWEDVPTIMPAYDVTICGSFIFNALENHYLVTFKIGDEVIASYYLEYGASIVVPDAPEREGYTFDGWGDVAEYVPLYDVTYEGSYTVNAYMVYYYVGEELVYTEEVAYGEVIPEYVYAPTNEEDEFIGWVGETYETMPAHNVTYTAIIEAGIEQLVVDNEDLNIYDLIGRKLQVDSLRELEKGIYIVNGQRVLIK